MRGLRFTKGKLYVQDHSLSKFQRYDLNWTQSDTNATAINHHAKKSLIVFFVKKWEK